MKNLFLFIVSLIFLLSAKIYGAHFQVLVTHNNPLVLKKNNPTWQPANIGDTLIEGDQLKLGKDNYLGLVHSCGQGKSITMEGTIQVSTLLQSFKPEINDDYFKILLSKEMLKQPKSQRYKEIKRRPEEVVYIEVASPAAELDTIIGSEVFLVFTNKSRYKIQLISYFEDVLGEYEFTGDTITVKPDLTKLDPLVVESFKILQSYHVMVDDLMLDGDGNITFTVKENKTKFDRVSVQRDLYFKAIGSTTALSHLLLGAYHEKLGFYFEALKHYYLAKQLAPYIADYKAYFAEFLMRKSQYRYVNKN